MSSNVVTQNGIFTIFTFSVESRTQILASLNGRFRSFVLRDEIKTANLTLEKANFAFFSNVHLSQKAPNLVALCCRQNSS